METLNLGVTSQNTVLPIPASASISDGWIYAHAPEQSDLLQWWNLLRRRIGTLILAALVGVLLAILLTIPQTPMYEGRTSLEVQDINPEFMNLKQVSPIADSTEINALSDLQTQIKILQSEAIADRTVAQTKSGLPPCVADPAAESSFQHFLPLGFLRTPPKLRRDLLLLLAAAKSVRVRAAGQTRIIEVLVDSSDPKIACGFANVLVSQFIEQSIEARYLMTQRTGTWLGRELDGMRLKLEHSEDALQAYARKSGLVYTGEKQSVSEEKLYQLQAELSKAQADRLAKQSLHEMTRTAPLETLPDVMSSSLRDLQAKLTDLRRQKAELGATFNSGYSKSKKVDAQITEIEAALQSEQKAIVDRIAHEYEEAEHHEKLLSMAYATQTRMVTQDSEKGIQYSMLKREVDTNRQIYEAMLQRVKESSIASAMKPSNIRVIDAAKLPARPYRPNLPLNASLGFLLGGMFGLAGVAIMSHADRSLHDPGDTALLLGVPELGVIPNAEFRRGLARRNLYRNLASDSSRFQSALQPATWTDQSALLANGFRGVVASILFSNNNNGARPRVLVITSASPGEGKTTASANLAQALAQINLKVLLIDADVRRPRIHKIFGLENQSGLTDLLKQQTLNEKEAKRHVQRAGGNLDVLTAGSSDAASNLFFSDKLSGLINYFKGRYDMVIIDTPPMLLVPEARMLGPLADATVLIVRAGQTTRDAALAIRQRLASDGTRVLGVILNDWNRKKSFNGYYGYSDTYKTAYTVKESV
ncbi:MAG: polysaccharide biosynthesis tyrosine autokinase [Acidobacteriota bacterium]|nr:polysaccharide biosynthesis tyrosine autokinase [Acidobacteriota bacterium]